MAEKGLRIKDQTEGLSIACRDAYELDENSDSRIFQITDRSSGQITRPAGSPTRSAILVSDGLDLSNLPADVTDNLIECGDKHTLVCYYEFLDTTASQYCKVQPLLFDNEVTPGIIAALDTSSVSCNSASSYLYQTSQGGRYLADAYSWNVVGAYKVGLYVSYLDLKGGSNGINLRGFMV